MFTRPLYDCAVTQIKISCIHDYSFEQETVDFVSRCLANNGVFDIVDQARKESGETGWFTPIASFVLEASKNCESFVERQQFARLLAGCFRAANLKKGQAPAEILTDAYQAVGLDQNYMVAK